MINIVFFQKMSFYCFLILSICLVLPSSRAVTLKEAYNNAKNYESVSVQKSRYQQSVEQVQKAKSGILPSVNLRGGYLTQEDEPIFDFPSLDRERSNLQIELQQPLFQGFKEWSALAQAKSQKKAFKSFWEREKIEVFQELYQVFFGIVKQREELALTEELLRLSRERMEFLKDRVDIGRSRESEVINARSRMSSVKAQVKQAEFRLIELKEKFIELTGLSKDEQLSLDNNDSEHTLKSLDHYLNKALASPWLKPEHWQKVASSEALSVAQADHYPSVDLSGNYYLSRQGSLSGVDWDVSVNLNFPIYEGGATSANIREAAEKKKEAELNYRLKRKKIRTNVRTAYRGLKKGREQLEDSREAVELNKQNYEFQKREYKLGLVSNLEVLEALNQYIESQKVLNNTLIQNEQNYYQLLALTGELFEAN